MDDEWSWVGKRVKVTFKSKKRSTVFYGKVIEDDERVGVRILLDDGQVVTDKEVRYYPTTAGI